MPKATLTFNLGEEEEKAAFTRAANAEKAYVSLWQISQEVFRPARKHGYMGNDRLNELLKNEDVCEASRLMETMFFGILEENNITLDDCC
jgi:hypothetical protein